MVARLPRQSNERHARWLAVMRCLARLSALAWLGVMIPTQAWAATAPATAKAAPASASADRAASVSLSESLEPLPGEVISTVLEPPVVASVEAPPPPAETIEYYAVDAIGSMRVVFAPDGTVLGRGDYLPFGEAIQAVNLPPERFTGQPRDAEAGLDYFGARAYQPRLGRFARVDPLNGSLADPQSWNAYAYVRNNPLQFTDPTGLQAQANCWELPSSFRDANGQAFFSTGMTCVGGSSGGGVGVDLGVDVIGCSWCSGGRTAPDERSRAGGSHWTPPPNSPPRDQWPKDLPLEDDTPNLVVLALTAGELKAVAAGAETLSVRKAAQSVWDWFTHPTPSAGQTVYRAAGGNAGALGGWWTPINPSTVANYRLAAGLPVVNAGRWLVEGVIIDAEGIVVNRAASLGVKGAGGLWEYVVPNTAEQIRVIRITSVHPPF